ncbi:hypothetical protein D3C77_543150 [compost metagenome]
MLHTHQNPHRLHRIEKDVPEIQLIRIRVIDSPDNMAANRRPLDRQIILRQAALTAAVQRQHRNAVSRIIHLICPVPTITGVAMEHRHCRPFAIYLLRFHVFRMDSRTACPGKI